MLIALFMLLVAWLLKFTGLMGLLGLSTKAYYLVFFMFGLVVHLIQMIKA